MGLTYALDLLVPHLKMFGCDAPFKMFCVICFMYVWTTIDVNVDMVAHNTDINPLLICYNVKHVLNLEWIVNWHVLQWHFWGLTNRGTQNKTRFSLCTPILCTPYFIFIWSSYLLFDVMSFKKYHPYWMIYH